VNAGTALAVEASPWGGGAFELAGTEVVLRPSGALWVPCERLLAAADLHLEKGSAYAARGQMLPPYDTTETLARLAAECALLRPRTVVLLGDALHDAGAEARLPLVAVRALMAIASTSELVWLAGNHDREAPATLPGLGAAFWRAQRLLLVHQPAAGPSPGEVSGHLHPCAKVLGRSGSVRRRCFVTDGERLVMPAFGAFAGGLNVRDAVFRGLFSTPPIAVALGRGRVHAVAWRRLAGD
jgi:DNA ligase-associated metallophosphoesterase